MEFGILGPLDVRTEEGRVELRAQKHRALLAVLLLHRNEVVAAEALIHALWGERPPASAQKLLQVYVSQLRKVLPQGRLQTRAPGYALNVHDEELDAARFERLLAEGQAALAAGNAPLSASRLSRALALWRGPAFADFAFDDFARAEADRLEELNLLAREALIEAELDLGRGQELLADLRALVATHPLRERLWAQLMIALYRAGRQADALDAYRDAHRTLDEEVGLKPGPELRRLEQAILNQDPSLVGTDTRPEAAALPEPPTRLVGRRRELADVVALLFTRDVRLVTLTGPGGAGKTRLALEVARTCAREFANGATLVELAAVARPSLVLPALAAALNVDESDGSDLAATLARHLRSRELLLLVDNFEQVLEAGPALASLLAEAPDVKVLVTSRAALRLSGEHLYEVPPLELPSGGDVQAVSQYDSVALFVERARAVAPSFEVTNENAPAVAEICARLEGLPLAIELAAARIRTLAPEALLARLEPRLPILTSSARDRPRRHQTLRTTIDWSYGLLKPQEQRLFARLGVFAGGFDVEAAEHVCDGDLDTVDALVGQSLLRRDAGVRLRMLETIREYALGRLDAGPDGQVTRRAHGLYLAELAEQAGPELIGPRQSSWLHRLESEHDNFRAALGWAHEQGEAELELRLATALGRFWYVRGHVTEGRKWLDEALTPGRRGQPAALRAKGFRAASALAVIQGDYAGAGALAQAGLDLYRRLDDRVGVARSLSNLGAILVGDGDSPQAARVLDEALALARELGDERLVALAANNRGDVALTRGEYERAAVLFEESLTLLRHLGDSSNVARALYNLAAVALEQGRLQEAQGRLRESITLSRELGDREDVAWCLVAAAALAARAARPERAATLVGAADALVSEMGASMKPFEQALRERTLAAVKTAVEPAELDRALIEGRALGIDEAIDRALEHTAE